LTDWLTDGAEVSTHAKLTWLKVKGKRQNSIIQRCICAYRLKRRCRHRQGRHSAYRRQ